jgi:ribosomal protein S18 acetylase RimI-like enzyme
MTIIRPGRAEDAVPLATLKRDTFRETFLAGGFAIPYPSADLAAFEAETYGVARVARDLAAADHRHWVAEAADGRLLAYAHAGPCKLPHPDVGAGEGELYQLYALREARGRGIGRLLLDEALAWLASAMPGPQWLGVWSGNDRAQAVYAGRGFVKVGDYRFAVGAHFDEEHIMRRPAA